MKPQSQYDQIVQSLAPNLTALLLRAVLVDLGLSQDDAGSLVALAYDCIDQAQTSAPGTPQNVTAGQPDIGTPAITIHRQADGQQEPEQNHQQPLGIDDDPEPKRITAQSLVAAPNVPAIDVGTPAITIHRAAEYVPPPGPIDFRISMAGPYEMGPYHKMQITAGLKEISTGQQAQRRLYIHQDQSPEKQCKLIMRFTTNLIHDLLALVAVELQE